MLKQYTIKFTERDGHEVIKNVIASRHDKAILKALDYADLKGLDLLNIGGVKVINSENIFDVDWQESSSNI